MRLRSARCNQCRTRRNRCVTWGLRVKRLRREHGTRRSWPIEKRTLSIENATCFCIKHCWCTRNKSAPINRTSSWKRITKLSHELRTVSFFQIIEYRSTSQVKNFSYKNIYKYIKTYINIYNYIQNMLYMFIYPSFFYKYIIIYKNCLI